MISNAIRDKRGVVVLLALAVLIATSAALCQVWTRLKVIEYGYKISTATRARRELAEANRRLRLEIAFLTNPGRIARVATEEMGLRPVTPEQVRRLHRPPRVPRGERRGSPAVARMTP